MRHLASGGLNLGRLVPDCAVRNVERALALLRRQLALHHLLVLQRDAGIAEGRADSSRPRGRVLNTPGVVGAARRTGRRCGGRGDRLGDHLERALP